DAGSDHPDVLDLTRNLIGCQLSDFFLAGVGGHRRRLAEVGNAEVDHVGRLSETNLRLPPKGKPLDSVAFDDFGPRGPALDRKAPPLPQLGPRSDALGSQVEPR